MVSVTLLGTAQDGGVPQVGCFLPCCSRTQTKQRFPVALGLTDSNGRHHLFEASRHMGEQLRIWGVTKNVDSLFLTHAHFGHVDGLGLFGKEVMNYRNLQLHLSNRMLDLMLNTPTWATLLNDGVFDPQTFSGKISLPGVTIEAIEVPHRAEHSDMHAFLIRGAQSLLFLPDHDTWQETLGDFNLRSWLNHLKVDIALLDGTFYSPDELGHRIQSEVPHPPVYQTIEMLGPRRDGDGDIVFIHLNHTNPLCHDPVLVTQHGWAVGEEGDVYELGEC